MLAGNKKVDLDPAQTGLPEIHLSEKTEDAMQELRTRNRYFNQQPNADSHLISIPKCQARTLHKMCSPTEVHN